MEEEAEARLWEIVEQAEIALVITWGEGGYPRVRPMTLLGYEEDGRLWFTTSRSSRKVEEITRDARVTACLLALEGGAYAQLFGEGEIVDDPRLREEFWEEEWEEFWDGPDDPDYVLLSIRAKKAEYYLIDEDELWAIEFP
jgi:general stress protein 26